jgi:fucose permease
VTSSRRWDLTRSLVIFAALGSLMSGLEAATPAFRATYHLTPAAAGLLVSAWNLGALAAMGALCHPATAALRTWCLGVSFAAGSLGLAAGHQLSILLPCAVIGGTGYGGLIVRINAHIARTYPDNATTMLSLVNAGFGAGSVIGPVIAGIGVQRDCAACALVVLACATARLAGDSRSGPPRAAQDTAHPGRIVIVLAAAAGLYAVLETGTGTWGPQQLIGLGYPPRLAAQLMGLFWAGLTTGRLLMPLARRLAPPAVYAGCVSACGTLLFLALIRPAAPAAYFLTGCAAGPVLPALVALAARRARNTAQATAAIFVCEAAGNIVVPLAIGGITARASAECLPFITAVTATLMILVSWTAVKTPRPARHAATPGHRPGNSGVRAPRIRPRQTAGRHALRNRGRHAVGGIGYGC